LKIIKFHVRTPQLQPKPASTRSSLSSWIWFTYWCWLM